MTNTTDPTVDFQHRVRESFRTLVAGVAVVTTSEADRSHGMTVTSLTSHSMSPPSVSFNISLTSRSGRHLRQSLRVGVSILSQGQAHIADHFASPSDDKFTDQELVDEGQGVPLIKGASAVLVCEPTAEFIHHDHAILIADIIEAWLSPTPPLVRYSRHYWPAPDSPSEPRPV